MLTLESELSADYVRATKPEHDAILREYAAKLRELDAIVMRERAFVQRANGLGYYPTYQVAAFWPTLGTIDDPQSLIASRMRDLRSVNAWGG